MIDHAALSERLIRALALDTPPVAVRFCNEAPNDIDAPTTAVSAGCAFWELGARQSLATTPADHKFCSIGIHTHNLNPAPDTQDGDLAATLAAMQGLDYVRPAEVGLLPVMSESRKYVVYQPLHEISDSPAVILVFANAAQGLILSEAIARIDGQTPLNMGRPACALIPQVVNSSLSASSLGCCGARAYLDVLSDDQSIWALHGSKLGQYIADIETFSAANETLRQFHEQRRSDIAAGQAPSVQQSLDKLN